MAPMKLSEAIRLGAMLKPQAFGAYTDGIGTCAIGAANDALGLPLDDTDTYPPSWEPIFSRAEVTGCPSCGWREDKWYAHYSIIAHLNDHHCWTREQIADWVETIERAEDEKARRADAASAALEPALTPSASAAQK